MSNQDFINAVKDYIWSEHNRIASITGFQSTEETRQMMDAYIEHSIPRYLEILKRAGVTDVDSLAEYRANIDRRRASGEPSLMDDYLATRNAGE